MASVVLDITTRGLDEAIRNVQGAKDLITAGTAVRMQSWYNTHMKKTMLNIIETGEGMAPNVGNYAIIKARGGLPGQSEGITHPLGLVTGHLYFEVSMSQPVTKETRGTEVRFSVQFDEPHYVAFVIGGTSGHVGRDFVTLARDKDWQKLLDSLGKIFNKLDFTKPYPELLSTVMTPDDLPSLTGNYSR